MPLIFILLLNLCLQLKEFVFSLCSIVLGYFLCGAFLSQSLFVWSNSSTLFSNTEMLSPTRCILLARFSTEFYSWVIVIFQFHNHFSMSFLHYLCLFTECLMSVFFWDMIQLFIAIFLKFTKLFICVFTKFHECFDEIYQFV